VVGHDTVNGKLVALPYHIDIGLLFYRTDLLHEYGYSAPPTTWSDLERMAARIQAGERAKGRKDFWGFVWEGAASEALTCNALEWQASEGGGRIIEKDKTISVNNPNVIRSWERAARWVGTISPKAVTVYKEWDALNVWLAGNAAFMRNWPTSYLTSRGPGSAIAGRFDAAVLPAGKAGSASTLGGGGLSVSRYSQHPKESMELVRFICRRDVQRKRAILTTQPPTIPELYDSAEVLAANPHYAQLKQIYAKRLVVTRPSVEADERYDGVSEAYFDAVHSVLLGKQTATAAAADLEMKLVEITGFERRKPSTAILTSTGGLGDLY
jgi:trehalose/maltose transport system substrate-binding protein